MTRRPDLFLIGAPKCGTTSLYEYLRGHPDIFMTRRKEPQYFAADLVTDRGLRYGTDLALYLALFADARDEKRVGEASTWYLESAETPNRLLEFQPKPYIVATLRNPVDMIHSLHWMRVAEGVEPVVDFAQALADEPNRAGFDRPDDLSALVYRERARYAGKLKRWLTTFGRERIHVIIFEEFVAEPAARFRELLEFLDVDHTYSPPTFETYNLGYQTRSPLLRRVMDARLPRRIARRVLPMSVRDRTTLPLGRRLRTLNRRTARRPPIPDDVRRQLEAEFADDVAEVGELLGRDLQALWFGGADQRRRTAKHSPAGQRAS